MEKAKNIYFIDQTSEFDHHMVFNASMLKILNLIFPEQKHFHYGLKSSINSVKTLLSTEDKEQIQFIPIKHKKVSGRKLKKLFNYFRKEIYRFNNFRHILKQSNDNDWIVLSITTFTSFLWFKFLKTFYKTNTIAVLHGEVSFIYKSYNKIEKIDALIHKLIFKIKAKNFYYLTLNKIEKKILVKDNYLKNGEVFEINHPYLTLEEKASKSSLNSKIRLGHIGSLVAHTKNSHLFFKLAEECKSLVEKKEICFDAVGLLTPEMTKYINPWVNLFVGNDDLNKPKYLSREDYENALENMDYALFFYPPEEYVFRASGAIADFIAKEIPIMYLEHPIFNYFQSTVGEIGYKCDNLQEMKEVILNLSKDKEHAQEKYSIHKENLKKLKELLDINKIAEDLKEQIKNRTSC